MDRYQEPLTKIDRISWFLTHKRLAVFLIILFMTILFLYMVFRVKGEVNLQDLFPSSHPYLKLHKKFSDIFGSGASTVVFCIKANKGDIFNHSFLTKVKNMTNEVYEWEEVFRSLTYSITMINAKVVKTKARGEIAIESLCWPDIPKTQEELNKLKKDIFSNEDFGGTMVSLDGDATLIFTEFKEGISYNQVHDKIQKLAQDYTDAESSVHVVGFPPLMGWIYSLKTQIIIVFVVSIIGMIVVLILIFYGNLLGMIVVMANTLILSIWGLGFIGFTQINFSPLLYVLAFLVGARMVGNSHQITYRYFEELHASGNDRGRACYETMRTMLIPNFAAVTTDAAGFAVLFLAEIALMQQIAIFMTFWMLSIILTGVMVPIICTLLPFKVASEKWAKESCQVDWLARLMMRVTQFSIGPGSRYVVSALILVLLVVCGWQMSHLKIGDPTPGSPLLWPNHVYNKDQALIDKKFDASSENFELFFEGKEAGSIYNPDVWNIFEAFDRHMKQRLPDIYKSSSSLNTIGRNINMILHDGDPAWRQLPRNDTMLTFIIGALRLNTMTQYFSLFVDPEFKRSRITLYFQDHTSNNLDRIKQEAYEFFKTHPMKIEKGEFMLAGGRIGLEMAVNEEMKKTHLIIDSMVLLAIFILCAFSFMSITAGLMLTLPLILANSVAGAYMALTNTGLTINTLPVAAIGVGVGVDFAIYLYSRCQEEFPLQGGDWSRTIIQSICTCGKAVVYTGLTIILPIITWYFSGLKFQAQVGFFLAMIMGTNIILTMTLHPLMIYLIKPKFISKHESDEASRVTR